MATRIAVCLFDETVASFDRDVLMTGNLLKKVNLNGADDDAAFFLKPSSESSPEWVDIVKGFSDIDKFDTSTASSGAILFLRIRDRILACCFGTSVANINKESIEHDFGLAVAFNRIPSRSYKSIETFALSENPITNNRSAAMPSSANYFNLDRFMENITELSGKYFSINRTVLVKGKEFFSVPSPLTIGEIKKLCRDLLTEYKKTINDPHFKELTAVNKVKVKTLIDHLNKQLCDSITKKSDEVYLTDYKHYEELGGYSLTPEGEKLTEVEIRDVYKAMKGKAAVSVELLRRRRIYLFDKDDQVLDEWPLYRCLFAAYSLNIGGFVFYKGNWYEVQERYLKDLKSYLSRFEIKRSDFNLPAWDGAMHEEEYNKDAAHKTGSQCWDTMLYDHPDFSYGIEFADLLRPDYVMHVKKLSRSSLTSHLLMQTYVSAQLLRSDPGIKKWISKESKAAFGKNVFLKASGEFKQPVVKYLLVLMAGKRGKTLVDTLPFFTLVTLNMLIRRINQLNFDVEICMV
jgi:uncharacterized protein (TIGR04141 family)